MSEIISALVVEPSPVVEAAVRGLRLSALTLQPKNQDLNDVFEACYLPALFRRIGASFSVCVFYLLGHNSAGYLTSSVFIHLDSDDRGLIKFGEARADLMVALEKLLAESETHKVILLAESTYSLGERDVEEQYRDFEIQKTMTLAQFLDLRDSDALHDLAIYTIRDS